jgi:hypothetical protein
MGNLGFPAGLMYDGEDRRNKCQEILGLEASVSKEGQDNKAKEPQPEKPRKKELDVVPHPSDDEDISDEMSDLFDEESVKHKHGHAEPEGD